jgi:hypothetical protein
MLSMGPRSWHIVARAAGTAVCLATLIAGCSTIRSMMPSAREAQRLQEGQRQLQAKCMRFADQYVGRITEESVRFERTATANPVMRQPPSLADRSTSPSTRGRPSSDPHGKRAAAAARHVGWCNTCPREYAW